MVFAVAQGGGIDSFISRFAVVFRTGGAKVRLSLHRTHHETSKHLLGQPQSIH